jgi:hypothetical protein
MATTTSAVRAWRAGRANRRALAKFAAFWTALQRVGDALADAERMTKNAEDTAWWRDRHTRHWAIATADEARAAVKICRRSLRVVSMSAKRFEPELIRKDWRR